MGSLAARCGARRVFLTDIGDDHSQVLPNCLLSLCQCGAFSSLASHGAPSGAQHIGFCTMHRCVVYRCIVYRCIVYQCLRAHFLAASSSLASHGFLLSAQPDWLLIMNQCSRAHLPPPPPWPDQRSVSCRCSPTANEMSPRTRTRRRARLASSGMALHESPDTRVRYIGSCFKRLLS